MLSVGARTLAGHFVTTVTISVIKQSSVFGEISRRRALDVNNLEKHNLMFEVEEKAHEETYTELRES
jgi:hypothetical protein